ncbi:MAG TPA: hypothetical protein GX506_11395 [Firmicutes bacterium]|nr:hypothetical protein [Bacillota bacterium]
MKKGYIKRVFPGNNTPQGFYSFYDQIIPPDARRIMIIKGGPGVGKSTFMFKIGEEMVNRGFDVEFHHCSSDNGSLDGVVIPAIGVALIDGTAPHILDPRNPGAVDEIIHLGDYWDEVKLRSYKDEIIRANAEISSFFSRAYRFLRAAKAVYDDWEAANLEGMDFGLANQKTDAIIRALFHDIPSSAKVGRERHLFASAITPDGMMNYLDTIVGPCKKKYIIEGDPGTGKSTLLQKVARAAVERGFDIEVYHCPLNPEKIEHVVIPQHEVALTKSIEPHTYTPAPEDTIIDLNECLSPRVTARNAEIIAEDKRIFELLFNKAIQFIGLAKAVHDRMESYYTPSMNFQGISALRERTLARILAYASEAGAKIA